MSAGYGAREGGISVLLQEIKAAKPLLQILKWILGTATHDCGYRRHGQDPAGD